jgi:hypothetical protein
MGYTVVSWLLQLQPPGLHQRGCLACWTGILSCHLVELASTAPLQLHASNSVTCFEIHCITKHGLGMHVSMSYTCCTAAILSAGADVATVAPM